MLLKAYPKINLYLHITGRETFGSQCYHLLRSRFVRVANGLAGGQTHGGANKHSSKQQRALCDEIEITPANATSDIVLGNFPCAVQESSVYRALCALRMIEGARFPPVRVEVCKHIPSGAGLGGGSADAGVVLRALIECYGEGFVGVGAQLYAELFGRCGSSGVLDCGAESSSGDCARSSATALAKSLGADVAFFLLDCDCAEVSGIGEEIAPCAPAVHDVKGFEIYTPEIFCDTARVYQKYSAMLDSGELELDTRDVAHLPSSSILDSAILDSLDSGGLDSSASVQGLNALYRPACALYPELECVRKELGAGWYFSGSGSSFFRPIVAQKSPESKESVESKSTKSTPIDSRPIDSGLDSSALDSRPLGSRA